MEPPSLEQDFKFYPLSFSWVAVHPQPKGIVQFIGGAFFGTFPTLFYRYLLKQLYLEGYTIVALPFRFTFHHWDVAISLLREQQALRLLLAQKAQDLGYEDTIYSQPNQYLWLGHSLGCKYIALLELLAEWCQSPAKVSAKIRQVTKQSDAQLQQIQSSIQGVSISIEDQRSLLMAPDISNTQDAIKIPLVPRLLDAVGLGVLPTKEETFDLIKQSDLFNLASMISFAQDEIAGNINSPPGLDNTVRTLLEILGDKLESVELEGKHLRPLGAQIGELIVGPIAAPPPQLLYWLIKFLG